jgi:hypothetical protein
MRMYSILPTGRKAVLALRSQEDAALILEWIGGDSSVTMDTVVLADVVFQPKNKTGVIENSCPIASLLSLVCVDQAGRDCFQALDPGGLFLPVRAGAHSFFVYRASVQTDAIASGWVDTPDGRRRLRAPVFSVDAITHPIFQLPAIYESLGETICSEEIVTKLKASKLSGLCAWDHQSRREERL